ISDQIPNLWVLSHIIVEVVKERDNGILNYTDTNNITQDILCIIEVAGQEKLQYWRFS
ncbi:hypothetical protein DFS33DRAFT_1264527, partial [Desarmillaria ectypa]